MTFSDDQDSCQFIFRKDDPYRGVQVMIPRGEVSLGELLVGFEDFLKACGYPLDGKVIELVDNS